MKNPLFLSLLMLSFTLQAFSQQLGIKVGGGFSNLAARADEHQHAVGSYHVGLMLKLPLSGDWLALQPEATFIRKGACYQATSTDVGARLYYVDAPVLLVVNPLGGLLNIHAGPMLSRLVDVKYKFTGGFLDGKKVDDDPENYHKWDAGFAVGAGLNLDKFLLEVRWTRGFRTVEKTREIGGELFGSSELNNFNLQASAGIFF